MIRKAIQKASRYGASIVGENVSGNQALKVLQNIDKTLSYLGLSHWVSMEEFAYAAVRVGLNRQVGIAVYHIMDFLI